MVALDLQSVLLLCYHSAADSNGIQPEGATLLLSYLDEVSEGSRVRSSLAGLEALNYLTGLILRWSLAAPLFLLLGVLWSLMCLSRTCRKALPLVGSALLRLGQLTKPSLPVVQHALLTLGPDYG